mgnify:CR=1 FL=1|tara:strand:- start:1345 stop:3558 length:2214 start_codon:yes stop_codon:yes gene_type:complete
MTKEEINFDADINQLMHLIINAFYSKSEIFLRELLSNSSDALEKYRFQSLTDSQLENNVSDLKIFIDIDISNGTLIIEDTGIGMTKDDLIQNLGTIAKSGTKSFIEKIKETNSANTIDQIGQFGVGFYSSYLVADNVKIFTKNDNDKEYIWESDSNKSYTICENETPVLKRGTKILLKIKEEHKDFLQANHVKDVVKKYMQFISYPIQILETKIVETEVEDEDVSNIDEQAKLNDISNIDQDEPVIETLEEEEQLEKKMTTNKTEVKEWVTINDVKPIWMRKPDEVDKDEYKSFYSSINSGEYLGCKHFNTEGQVDLNCVLFIPENNMAMFDNSKKNNMKLFVKNVFITENCENLVPSWLAYLVGVVNSDNIPLNVSRELLQENKIVSSINKVIVKKAIELFNEIAENTEDYNKFYGIYSKMIKLGIHEDEKNRDKLIKLLRFYSLNSKTTYISLDQYVESMKEEQKDIYYITGQNITTLEKSPFIEKLKEKNYDVLFFDNSIDEYMIQNVKEYNDIKLSDVSKKITLDDKSDEKDDNNHKTHKELVEFFKSVLSNKVSEVIISTRLTTTPCMLSSSEFGWTANMERIMKAQAIRNEMMDQFMSSRKVLELNINHKLIVNIDNKFKDENNKVVLVDLINIMYDTALLNSGFLLDNPVGYATKVNKIITHNYCMTDDDEVKEEVKDAVKDEVNDAVKDEVNDAVKNEVNDAVKDEVNDVVKDEVKDENDTSSNLDSID